MNLQKLYYIKKYNNIYYNQILIKKDVLKMKKILKSYKDYYWNNDL